MPLLFDMTHSVYPQGLSAWGDPPHLTGPQVLTNPLLNKGTAFTERERITLGLRGLLPPRVFTIEEQLQRTLTAVRGKSNNLEKYI
mgnify:FL=1